VGQPPSRLKPPQQYGHYALAPAQGSGANGAKGLGPASNGTGNGIVGVEAVNGDTEESPEDIISRQAKAIRTKTAKIQVRGGEGGGVGGFISVWARGCLHTASTEDGRVCVCLETFFRGFRGKWSSLRVP